MFILFLGFFLTCFSFLKSSETLTETLTTSFSLGFEETTLKWAANDSGTTYLRQNFNNLKFLTFRISLGTIQRNFLFNTNFSYASLGRGDLFQNILLLNQNVNPAFEARTKGQTLNPELQIGYYIYLTPDHFNKIFLIPKIGYGANFFDYYVKSSNTASSYGPLEFNNLQNSKTLKQTWDGFFVGGSASVKTYDGFQITLSYFYHFENLNQTLQSEFTEIEKPLSTSFVVFQSQKKTHHGFSHDASLDCSYNILQRLNLSALMRYQYLSSSNNPMTLTQNTIAVPSGASSKLEKALNFSVDHEVFDVYFCVNLTF